MSSAGMLAGLSLLVIGDSHLATPSYLIDALPSILMEQGAKVHAIGVCGAMPADWLVKTPGSCGGAERTGASAAVVMTEKVFTTPINKLIESERPSAVVVVSGDNIGSYMNPVFPKTWANQQVTSLTKALSAAGVACYWVGPAWGTEGGRYGKTFARVKELDAFLKENVSPCTYIDSTKFSGQGEWKTIDGQHFLASGYRKWASSIADEIIKNPPRKLQ